MFSLRVHIAPVGFEIDRIIEPLVKWKADRVYLITEKDIEHSEAKYYFKIIKHRLSSKEIEVKESQCNIRDLYDVLGLYKKIIDEEKNNQIFINVSSGNKIESIAGMMACMTFKTDNIGLKPYYVVPDSYDVKPAQGQQMTSGCKNIFTLPNYTIQKPSEDLIKALEVIRDNNIINKTDLIKKYVSNELIKVKKDAKNPKVAEFSQLNKNILSHMLKWGFITMDGEGKRCRIKITEDGINALKFLPNGK